MLLGPVLQRRRATVCSACSGERMEWNLTRILMGEERGEEAVEGGSRGGDHRARVAARMFTTSFANTTVFLSHVVMVSNLLRGVRATVLFRNPEEPVSIIFKVAVLGC